MTGVFLLLGSNMGIPFENLQKALIHIKKREIQIENISSIVESEPWGDTNQPWFLNIVVEVNTNLEAPDLLNELLLIETEMGRKRIQKWGPRLIDIDILYFGNQVIQTPDLVIPHPGIPDRRFTLLPLVEIAPEFYHPVLGKTNKMLLQDTTDGSICKWSKQSLQHDLD